MVNLVSGKEGISDYVELKNFIKIKHLVLILIILIFLPLNWTKAQEFKLIPSFNIKEEYNDNLFFTEKDKQKDFITTISPAIELSNKTERLDLNFSGRLNRLIYGKNDNLNKLEHNYRGRFRYSINPELSVSLNGSFLRDYRPDRDIEITGLVTKAIRRNKLNFGCGSEYKFSEITKGNFSYSFEKVDFERDPEFVDTKAHEAIFGFIYDLSQYMSLTMGRANVGYGRFEFLETSIDYFYGTIGVGRALSEKWNFIIDIGGSYTHSEFDVYYLYLYKKRKERDGGGFVGQAILSYRGEKTIRGEKTLGDLIFTHRLMPSSGTIGATKRTSLAMEISHRFTYEMIGKFSSGYYINKAKRGEFGTEKIDERTFRLNPTIRYEFTKDIALEASYSFVYLWDKDDDTKARRNLFMLNLVIQYPLFE